MRVVQINTGKHGSTGIIMLKIAEMARKSGIDALTFSSARTNTDYVENHFHIGTKTDSIMHRNLAYVTGFSEFFSYFATKKLVKQLADLKPDVIHLHNLHGWYLNLPLLFGFIKENKIPVIWTLHDCWSFTGCCAHFDFIGCEKWKTQCHKCPQHNEYPRTLIDSSRFMYKMKKEWFTGVENLTIVTPSFWLANLVKQSFLKEYPVKVINNGIDLNIFAPCESNFREQYGLDNKFVILGVASVWRDKKGLDVFIELAKLLDDNFRIVMVGTDENVDKQLPDNIISIHRTYNQQELAKIYTAADLFLNPTREEVFGLVNIEALACGTPVVTFNSGGSPECIDETCGKVIENNDIDTLYNEIIICSQQNNFSSTDCIKRSKLFNNDEKFNDYIQLYKNYGK